jgi:hypothetical protein
MISALKFKKIWVLIGMTGMLLSVYGHSLLAGQEKTIEQYIEEAQPYLHLSCQGAWDASGEDPDEYVAIMNRFVAIAFINHDFDVQRIYEAPQADQDELSVLFYNEIGRRCEENPQRLLAGIVERSLEFALNEMKERSG